MAAKVVMLAIPTVMGIASIRVYTVSEAPTDGLLTREKLNIYTPLPMSAQALFVPETPGVIQNGLTTARQGIRPFVQAVKGACISVKTRSVNLYHKGEDAYYYLKDPPPELLPRFGTITMAGVLGMFLARKGSQLKRPQCVTPAQTVAVFKITGKKVYSVGQWTGASVSSLFASKPPPEPVAREIAASQLQTTTVPNPESAARSSLIPESEVESAESLPLSDEPAAAIISEQASSVTLTENSPDQTPAETNPDPVVHSVAAETEVTSTSEEIAAPVESEDAKLAAKEASTAEPTASLEPETVEDAPLEASPVEDAPVEGTAVEAAPVQVAEVEATPLEAAEVEAAPEVVSPIEAAPEEAAPVEAVPVEAVPVEAAPVEAVPVEAVPVEAAPVEAVPVEAVPVEAAPLEAAPVEAVPVEAVPVEAVPVEAVPVEAAQLEAVPVEAVPVEAVPLEAVPLEAVPVEAVPVEAVPVEAVPVEAVPLEAVPVEAVPVEAVPVEAVPVEAVPVEAVPVEAVPVEAVPEEAVPEEAVPVEAAPVRGCSSRSCSKPPAPMTLDDPAVPVLQPAEPELAAEPVLANATEAAAVEETLTPTPPQHEAENSKGGSSFKPDPSLLDFGQSSPEDDDLYSTRT
ncbi:hypothetical protein KUCAC02_004302 [Chaenocephalus aceratus]|uniref:Uncharacterized protein n=1 Tax=Chaenocephalus aceratus TaxID=36190 RepID=A0ACB9WY61_CHAAC|nr:hypothetical protein KUCAC02_004302 [Chaenocephalus aceratus]